MEITSEEKKGPPALQYEVDMNVKVVMSLEGFKVEYANDLQANLACLLVAKRVMGNVDQTYKKMKLETLDYKLKKALSERLPNIGKCIIELSKACEETFHIISLQMAQQQKKAKEMAALGMNADGSPLSKMKVMKKVRKKKK